MAGVREQSRLISPSKEVNNTSKIARLLADGATQSQVARALGVSPPYITKVAKALVQQGLLVRSGIYPVLFSWADQTQQKDINQISRTVRENSKGHLFEPHHFGVSYFIVRRPERWQGYNKVSQLKGRQGGVWQRFVWHEGDFTIEAYPNKVKVWCFAFTARTVPELIREGGARIQQRAMALQREHGCQLAYDKPLKPYDWLNKDPGMRKLLKNILNLEVAPAQVGDVVFKTDRSHPGQVEIVDADPSKTTEAATKAAMALEGLIKHAPEIQIAAQGYQTIMQSQMQISNLITQNTAVLHGLYKLMAGGKDGKTTDL